MKGKECEWTPTTFKQNVVNSIKEGCWSCKVVAHFSYTTICCCLSFKNRLLWFGDYFVVVTGNWQKTLMLQTMTLITVPVFKGDSSVLFSS